MSQKFELFIRKVKLFILKFKTIYKYTLPSLLILCFIESLYEWIFGKSTLYTNYYYLSNESKGFSILVCLMWIYEWARHGKCMWYLTSVLGLLYLCIINLCLFSCSDYSVNFESYMLKFRLIGLFITTGFIIYFMHIEKDKICKNF
jgi:hypothetical protein